LILANRRSKNVSNGIYLRNDRDAGFRRIMKEKGYVQVYTGNGKGKTTAALGLALRAAGAGHSVLIAQFLKKGKHSEMKALEKLSDWVTVKQYGTGCFVVRKPSEEDFRNAERGFEEVKQLVLSGEYRVVILDELSIATYYRLLSVDDVLELISSRPPHVELVITGRNADPRILDVADLVTEMREIKHYFAAGVRARVGIEK